MAHGVTAVPRACSSCKSEHVGVVPCGMTWIERLRSVSVDSSVTPTRTRKNYYDDDSLSELFGGKSGDERHEQMMEETQGVGTATPEEVKAHTELAAAHYIDPA